MYKYIVYLCSFGRFIKMIFFTVLWNFIQFSHNSMSLKFMLLLQLELFSFPVLLNILFCACMTVYLLIMNIWLGSLILNNGANNILIGLCVWTQGICLRVSLEYISRSGISWPID